MPDRVLAIFASLALILLVRPPLFLRRIPNPLLPDTPWNRVQMRGIGLVFCLFVLLVLSGGARNQNCTKDFIAISWSLCGSRSSPCRYSCGFSGNSLSVLSFLKATLTEHRRTQHGSVG